MGKRSERVELVGVAKISEAMPEEAPMEPMLVDEALNGDTGATPSDAGPTPIDVGAPAGAPTTSIYRC